MIQKLTKIIIILMILAGTAICYTNFATTNWDAGEITKAGTYSHGTDGCLGVASNGVDV